MKRTLDSLEGLQPHNAKECTSIMEDKLSKKPCLLEYIQSDRAPLSLLSILTAETENTPSLETLESAKDDPTDLGQNTETPPSVLPASTDAEDTTQKQSSLTNANTLHESPSQENDLCPSRYNPLSSNLKFVSIVETARPTSLLNATNFCYRNASLQLLLNSPVFLSYLLEFHIPEEHNASVGKDLREADFSLLRDLSRVAEKYWSSDDEWLNKKRSDLEMRILSLLNSKKRGLDQALSTFWRHTLQDKDLINDGWIPWISRGDDNEDVEENPVLNENASRYTQQLDTIDFQTWLLTSISTQLAGRTSNDQSSQESAPTLTIPQQNFALLTQITQTQDFYCPQSNCSSHHGRPSPNEIQSNLLRLTIPTGDCRIIDPQPLNLSRCLSQHQHVNLRDLVCPSCGIRNSSTRSESRISAAPEMLFLALNRYWMVGQGESTRYIKLPARVEIEPELDIAEFCERELLEKEGDEIKYKLRGVVSHRGRLEMGHYKAFVRKDRPATVRSPSKLVAEKAEKKEESSQNENAEEETRCTDTWYEIDDVTVEECKFEDILSSKTSKRKKWVRQSMMWTPVLMLYERVRGADTGASV